jgi:hypothetical protein
MHMTATAHPLDPAPRSWAARLERLRALRAAQAGEASFFFYDAHFKSTMR